MKFILIIFWLGGAHPLAGVTTEEFEDKAQCNYVAGLVRQERSVQKVFCVAKGSLK